MNSSNEEQTMAMVEALVRYTGKLRERVENVEQRMDKAEKVVYLQEQELMKLQERVNELELAAATHYGEFPATNMQRVRLVGASEAGNPRSRVANVLFPWGEPMNVKRNPRIPPS
ncbi:hypothetical protein [Bacillus fonticola]|uniref:hypothetical protein n=1 Tax=Bacillus fonticola TaxID=2728853 RepID=UPI001474E898|nr:hypothetical protein [Bacillus fonticola]